MATGTETDLPRDLIDRAMQLPAAGREKLGRLLLDSVPASETTADTTRDLIRERIGQLVRGEVELLDADDVVMDLERRYGPENPS